MTANKLPHFGADITDRELDVLKGMSYGLGNAQIGRNLFLSEDTVKTHARRLFRKLGAVDRAHAVRLGMETGWLSPDRVREPSPSPRRQGPRVDRHLAVCFTGLGCQCRELVAS